jgi:hypothetical protein
VKATLVVQISNESAKKQYIHKRRENEFAVRLIRYLKKEKRMCIYLELQRPFHLICPLVIYSFINSLIGFLFQFALILCIQVFFFNLLELSTKRMLHC